MIRRIATGFAALALIAGVAGMAGTAQARGGVSVWVGAPIVVGPPAYYYPPPPVVYAPPPPVVYAPPPPVVYAPPPPAPVVSAAPASAPYVASNGQTCRQYQTTIMIDGQAQPSYGTACLQADGTWRVVR